MNTRGMSLPELLVGLAVASMVAAIALTALSLAGLAAARQRAAAGTADSAWLALAAIARDLRESTHWEGCIESTACTGRASHRATSVLRLGHAMWFVEDGLKRCPKGKPCETYLDGVIAAEFIADVHDDEGGVRRKPFSEEHGTGIRSIEVILSMKGGRRYARAIGRPDPAQ